MRARILWLGLAAVMSSTVFVQAGAHGAEPFYEGKTIRMIHGFGTGGGFDTSARTVARHLTEHIPGNPEIVVQSMEGAGALIAMNYVYSKAKPDGLTIGYLFANQLVREILGGPGVQFDSAKYEWLGSPTATTPVCTAATKSGITSLEDWKNAKEPVKWGAVSRSGDLAYGVAKLLKELAGLPTQIVIGHQGGNNEMKLAAQRGEIAGFCGSLEATRIVWGEAIDSGKANVIVQIAEKPNPKIPDVPMAKDLVTDDDWQLIAAAIVNPAQMTRVFAFPPGTPRDKVRLMRKAMAATYEDPDFIADAKKVGVSVNPVSGEEVERLVNQMHSLSPETIDRLNSLLSN